MGQKVNPVGIRLGITKEWSSRWYANSQTFPDYVEQDHRIREFLRSKLKEASISRIHIERPWGEQIALPVYDLREDVNPIVDNIAEEGTGLKFVSAIVDAGAIANPAATLRFLLSKMTWQQFRMDLDDGEVQAPEWDLKQIRGNLGAFMAASLPRRGVAGFEISWLTPTPTCNA